MADRNDYYLGEVVTEGEMDAIYDDMIAAERNMAKEANLGQGPVSGGTQSGGILNGLTVTKLSTTSVTVALGAARDSDGKRISLPSAASVSLANLGDTPEGTTSNATGDGTLLASSITAGEAWVSLYIAFDTHLADARVDALNNTIYFRQTESFHFHIAVGTDAAAPATNRPALADDKVLLCDILCDNSGDIRTITAIDAICGSSYDFAAIGYGIDDAANLAGRRSDWCSLDPDGTALELWHNAADSGGPNGKAYFHIREGDPRKMMLAFATAYNIPGDATTVAGSELIGAKQTTGASLSSPGSAVALNLAASSSIHDQLVQLRDKVNTLLSRGSDTLTGNLTITGSLSAVDTTITGNLTHTLGAGKKHSVNPAALVLPGDQAFSMLDKYGKTVELVNAFGLRRRGRYVENRFDQYVTNDWVTTPPSERFLSGGQGSGYAITQNGLGGPVTLATGTANPSDVWLASGGLFRAVTDGEVIGFYARFTLNSPITDMKLFLGLTDNVSGGDVSGASKSIGLEYDTTVDGTHLQLYGCAGGGPEARESTTIVAAGGTLYEFYMWFSLETAATRRIRYWLTGMGAIAETTSLSSHPTSGSGMFSCYAVVQNVNASAVSHSIMLHESHTWSDEFASAS